MKGTIRTFTVQGQPYEVWSDFTDRCTYAKNANGITKRISSGGYIHNPQTVRKAIAVYFDPSSAASKPAQSKNKTPQKQEEKLMETYEINLMAQKEGKQPARLGIVDVEAPSEQEALDLALDNLIHTYRTNPYIDHSKPLPKLWTELA